MDVSGEVGQFLAFANELADAARKILKPAMSAGRKVTIKADASLVTETDLAVESRMRAMIDKRYPNHGVLGEEHGSRDVGSDFVWVLDPIDGTAPFVAGIPVFGTLIGLAREGQPFLGVVDHVATDERWCGVRGAGATHNGEAVGTRRGVALSNAFLTNSSPDFFSDDERLRFHRLRSQVRYTQYGGSCYAYAALASGRTDLGVDAGLETFDIFAPAAVIEGAGGVVTDWRGHPLSLQWAGQVLAAGDRQLHALARDMLS